MMSDQKYVKNAITQLNQVEDLYRFGGPYGALWLTQWVTDNGRTPPPGTIIPQLGAVEYTKTIKSSYSNVSNAALPKQMGERHVGLGFCDLSVLFSADNLMNVKDFYGIDNSPFAVAKSKVIAEMMMMETEVVPTGHIIQVWYSSGWSRGCLDSFYLATNNVLEQDVNLQADVCSYLSYWLRVQPKSVKEARQAWGDHQNARLNIGNLLRRKDRMALVHYQLTGEMIDVSDKEIIEIENITMWKAPEGAPPLEENESLLHTCHEVELGKAMKEYDEDIMEAATRVIRNKIDTVRAALRNGLKVHLEVDSVSKNKLFLDKVKRLEASTISWSNLIDYFPSKDFHFIAKSISNDCTRHFGYSMNWPVRVWGSSLYDYKGQTKLKDLLERSYEEHKNGIKEFGLDKYFISPLLCNPINEAIRYIGNDLKGYWKDYKFSSEYVKGEVDVIQSAIVTSFGSLSYSPAVMPLEWTYK